MKAPFPPAPETVRRALDAHGWLGLLTGAAMYLVCLTGTLLVFHDALVRWEQPAVDEFRSWTPETVAAGFEAAFADPARRTPHLFAVLPTESMPRLRLASEEASWYLNADGSLGPAEANGFTELLVTLHYYLHLPEGWGMVLVSALGALLVGLVVTGFLAHPSLLRDAFRLRLGGNRRLGLTDLHNRLGVWGTPFHLMIAVTGAYFGFALPLAGVYADRFADGDRAAVVAEVFGEDPGLDQPGQGVAVERALADVRARAPGETPFLLTVHDAGTPGRHVEVATRVPGSLVYSEDYLYDAQGAFLARRGLRDGDPGRRVVYALYRLHFGSFAGVGVQLLYGVLGLGLTVLSATGISLWLARRRRRTFLDDLWVGAVWGVPPALAAAAADQLTLQGSPAGTFWATAGLGVSLALLLRDDRRARRILQGVGAVSLALLVVTHGVAYGFEGGAAAGVNVVLASAAALLGGLALDRGSQATVPTRVSVTAGRP